MGPRGKTFIQHHAFRLGVCAWGLQFHPEYDARIMRDHIEAQAEELESTGRDVQEILATVADTSAAASLLKTFAGLVRSWSAARGDLGDVRP